MLHVLLLSLAFLINRVESVEQISTKPHIIFILADDLGWDDVSFHGSDQIPTPHIDELANSGVILNNYYVQQVCSPSRSAIMTGRYPIHTGMQHSVIMAGQPYGLGLNETLLPQHLKEQGYATHAVGKWHLGFFKMAYTPTYRGFDSFFGYWLGAGDYWDHSEGEPAGWGLDLRNNTEPVFNEWGNYRTKLFTSKAVDVIGSHDPSKPLFLYLAHEAVHSACTHDPLQAPADLIAKFKHSIKDERRQIFAAVLTALDMSIGKVVDALKARGLYDNSVIVFSTDNGGPVVGCSRNVASNYPLRGSKYTFWEGGVRGTGFVHSPLLPAKGRVSMDLMHLADWLPTLYGLAGGDVNKLHDIDGYDMWPMLSTGKEGPRHELVHTIDPIGKIAALRLRQWKLIVNATKEWNGWYPRLGYEGRRYPGNASWASKNVVVTCGPPPANPPDCTKTSGPCLFDIEADPCEYTNLADKQPDVLSLMFKMLAKYEAGMVPPKNKPYDHSANPKYHGGVWEAWKEDENNAIHED